MEGGYHGIVLVPNVVERTPPYVEEVLPGSPAAKAGMRPDDLIVYVDGEPVTSIAGFRDQMSRTRPGQTVKLEVRRGEKLEAVELKLESLPKR
jgi:serine protease Do